jgi:hypothetical protein
MPGSQLAPVGTAASADIDVLDFRVAVLLMFLKRRNRLQALRQRTFQSIKSATWSLKLKCSHTGLG